MLPGGWKVTDFQSSGTISFLFKYHTNTWVECPHCCCTRYPVGSVITWFLIKLTSELKYHYSLRSHKLVLNVTLPAAPTKTEAFVFDLCSLPPPFCRLAHLVSSLASPQPCYSHPVCFLLPFVLHHLSMMHLLWTRELRARPTVKY